MTSMHRRTFLVAAGITALAAPRRALLDPSNSSSMPLQLTGNGEWMYVVVSSWGALPAGTTFRGTHGAIAQDKAGNIYVSTTQEWPQRERLTFDTKGEIIIFIDWIAALPGGGLMLFSPSLRIHSSFIIGSCPSAHSEFLRGG